MKTITKMTELQVDIREEYRIALRLWSETRALYPAYSAEVNGATEHLATLEYQLTHPDAARSEPLVPALET